MGKLLYMTMMSVDGYMADKAGQFDWSVPDPAIHAFINDIHRQIDALLYGRRMYEVMSVWEHDDLLADLPAYTQDFAAAWRQVDKIVYSGTLPSVKTQRTRLERKFDPAAVRQMKAATDRDLVLVGPTLARAAFQAGLVDLCHVFVVPAVVGGGLAAFPPDLRFQLALQAQRRFPKGAAYCRYEVKR